MNKRNIPFIIGVFDIVAGLPYAILPLLDLIRYDTDVPEYVRTSSESSLFFGIFVAAVSIVGGVFAIMRRRWGWTLAASIVVSQWPVLIMLPTFFTN